MISAEFLKLKEARAEYVRALRRYEARHSVVIDSIKILRQTMIETSETRKSRSTIAGIIEKELNQADYIEAKIGDIEPIEKERDMTIVMEDYEE